MRSGSRHGWPAGEAPARGPEAVPVISSLMSIILVVVSTSTCIDGMSRVSIVGRRNRVRAS